MSLLIFIRQSLCSHHFPFNQTSNSYKICVFPNSFCHWVPNMPKLILLAIIGQCNLYAESNPELQRVDSYFAVHSVNQFYLDPNNFSVNCENRMIT